MAGLRIVLIAQAIHSADHTGLLDLVKALAPTARVEVRPRGSLAMALLAGTPVSQPPHLLIVYWVRPDKSVTEGMHE